MYVLEGAMVLLVDLLPSGGVLPHHKTVIIFANCTNKLPNSEPSEGPKNRRGPSINVEVIICPPVAIGLTELPKSGEAIVPSPPVPTALLMDTMQSVFAPLCYTFISNSN